MLDTTTATTDPQQPRPLFSPGRMAEADQAKQKTHTLVECKLTSAKMVGLKELLTTNKDKLNK